MSENKQEICDLLVPVLKATRNLYDLEKLTYIKTDYREDVVATFTSGYEKTACVNMDSGTAMIRDIIVQIV